jgi:hypothetical protein
MAHPRHSTMWIAKCVLCAVAMICGLAATAGAQWTVINLHPAGSTESRANGMSGGIQVGQARVDGWFHACMWNGSAASWVDLHPAGSNQSWASGLSADQQVGLSYGPPIAVPLASLWFGTPAPG